MKVPKELMVPIGAEATKRLGKCADTWSDSEVAVLRSQLPLQYHAYPLDALRMQWVNIRKSGTDGYRVNGHGPWSKKPNVNQEYGDYLNSQSWKDRRVQWLRFWDNRCAICNGSGTVDVHHRTYERVGMEKLNDCVVLCRKCHSMYHDCEPGLFD